MRSSTFSVLLFALALALPAQAHHAKSLKLKARVVAAAPVPAPVPASQPFITSKGTRIVAQITITPTVAPKSKAPAPKKTLLAASLPIQSTESSLAANGPVGPKPTLPGRLARLTAYWTDEDYWTSRHMSSTGVHLQEGHCAVDPKLIPYGSVVKIPGMGSYLAVDTGSAVVSRQAAIGAGHTTSQRDALVVDLFFENRKEAEQFANNGPSYVAVSWSKPLTATDAPQNPKALPVVTPVPAPVYVLASAPSFTDLRMPMAFRAPQM